MTSLSQRVNLRRMRRILANQKRPHDLPVAIGNALLRFALQLRRVGMEAQAHASDGAASPFARGPICTCGHGQQLHERILHGGAFWDVCALPSPSCLCQQYTARP